jgi:hypothetical protein
MNSATWCARFIMVRNTAARAIIDTVGIFFWAYSLDSLRMYVGRGTYVHRVGRGKRRSEVKTAHLRLRHKDEQ